MNHKMLIAYDGTHYFGWQKTKAGPSIQEALEKALFQILRHPVILQASSRTDRGVHARGQVVNFFLTNEKPFSRLLHSLNSVLPSEIRALDIEQVAEDFHPTLCAVSKEYRYYICSKEIEDPMNRLYAWHIHRPLDLDAMQRAALLLVGTHDFGAFTTKAFDDTIRTLLDIQIVAPSSEQLEIRIRGDQFLYKMARRLVGTLVAVGKHTLSEKQVASLLTSPNRAKAGMTAPAHGLFLHRVYFTHV